MQFWKKCLGVFVCSVILLSNYVNSLALPNNNETGKPSVVRELIEHRDANSNTYLLSDGTMEWVGYAEKTNYLDSNGTYQKISNKVIEEISRDFTGSFGHRNESNEFTIRFAEQTGQNRPILKMDYDKKAISILPEEIEAVTPSKLHHNYDFISDSEACISYNNIIPNVDFVYEVLSNGVKEYIVINKSIERNSFTFFYSLTGLEMKCENNVLYFHDKNGKNILQSEELYAFDASGQEMHNLHIESQQVNNLVKVNISMPQGYLTDPNTKYPVVIDPSVMITGGAATFDTFVCSEYPNSNYYLESKLRTGSDSPYGARRTFIKFTVPTNIPSGYVSDAYVRMEKESGATPRLLTYRVNVPWESNTIKWSNMPLPISGATQISSTSVNDSGNWWSIDITNTLVYWLQSPNYNYGLMIRDSTETGTAQWTTFYSSDAPSPHKPELHIEFSKYTSRPFETNSSFWANCASYALDYGLAMDVNDFDMTVSGLDQCTSGSLWTYTNSHIKQWLASNMTGYYNGISNYKSYISSGKWRTVVRIGYNDRNHNNIVDIDNLDPTMDQYDYHWWYQTSTGQWAEKRGSSPAGRISGTDANTNPGATVWNSFYNSTCAYYAIFDH